MSWCELPEFFSESKHTARKEYVCCECGTKILKGEVYWRSSGKWHGELSTYKQHKWCRALCTNLSSMDYYEGCIGFGQMFDSFGEIGYDAKNSKNPKDIKCRKYMAKVKNEMRRPERKVVKPIFKGEF